METPSTRKPKMTKEELRPYLVRLVIVLVLSIVLSGVFNEVTYSQQKDEFDRAPRTFTLVIPAGTAQRIAEGTEPGLPGSMSFVVGDVLAIKNDDSSAHQVGPVFVPPGTTGTLAMNQADTLAYDCSFRSNRYLGIEVRPATTWITRIQALLLAAPTTAVLVYLYSLLIWPIRKKDDKQSQPVSGAPAA